jgi:pimeloyl-ACP methyl ester carboxylesterase
VTQPNSKTHQSGQYIHANGLEIYYEEHGQGEPLILLHGGTNTSSFWNLHIPYFSPHFRVITPDSRGHGRTVNPARELSYSTMADDLAAFIQALGLEKPFIFGYSDGGQTALDLGMRYPNLAKALVIGGAWYRFSEEYQNALKNAGYEGPRLVNYEKIKKNAPPDWIERLQEAHPDPDPAYYRTLLEGISTMWWTPLDYGDEDFQRIIAPALIIMGERDEMIPLEEAYEMADLIPRGELAVIPGASHNGTLKDGGLFINIVLEFLARHSD